MNEDRSRSVLPVGRTSTGRPGSTQHPAQPATHPASAHTPHSVPVHTQQTTPQHHTPQHHTSHPQPATHQPPRRPYQLPAEDDLPFDDMLDLSLPHSPGAKAHGKGRGKKLGLRGRLGAKNSASSSHDPYRMSDERNPVARSTHAAPARSHSSAAPSHRSQPPRRHRLARILLLGLWVVLTGVLIAGLLHMYPKTKTEQLAVDPSKYQAVFFTNGQVYFGKLSSFNKDYLKLSDVYYLQTQTEDKTTGTATDKTGAGADSQNPQDTATNANNVQLIKLGSEIHGPQDEMTVSKTQVLFYENLKSDSKVAKSIAQYKARN